MSLRTRLFLIIGGLAALLVLAQWWWTRKLTRELSDEVDEVASTVGYSVASFFTDGDVHLPGEHDVRRISGTSPAGGLVWEESIREEQDDGETTQHRMVKVFTQKAQLHEGEEPASRQRHAPPQRILEFDAGTGDVEIVGDPEALGEDVEVRDLGGGRFAFAFRSKAPDPESEEDVLVTGAPKKFVQLHIEHEGEERYLWMGGPQRFTHRFEIPQQGMRQKLDGFSRKLLLASLGILAVGLVLAGAAADRVSAPLRRLAGAAREVGEGALGTRVPEAASGEVGQAIAAFNLMSERLAELEAMTRELSARQHLGEIGEIARGLAHSLRNPLNALGLSVEELAAGARENDGDESPELAVSARRQIRRIDHSIRSFLALASQDGGTAEAVDLTELVEDVALEALQGVRGKVRVQVDVLGDAAAGLAPLSAVEPELRAVVQALVVNAVEASPEGGTVTVRLRSSDGGRVRLEVDDQGAGLPPEVRAKLFTPHLSTKASGSGMGLFLAHRIATNRYRGRLDLVDLEPTGTRAVLELGDRVEGPTEDAGR